tara:strand:- start:48 stop:290 length:243 start_codon:yes stop_codon:yes gene_type:complete
MLSPNILNNKIFEKRKNEVYKLMKKDYLYKKNEQDLKRQAKNEVTIIKAELNKNNNDNSHYDINILYFELNDFINKNNRL